MQNRYYMKDEAPFQDFPVYTEKTGGKAKGFIVFLIVIILIAAIVGGLYYLGKNKKLGSNIPPSPTKAVTPTVKPTETPSASPSGKLTPTPSVKLDRSKLNVAVLNGSGVPGAANKTASSLKALGYVIGATANASKFNYTGITVLVKKAESDYGDLLKKDLSDQGSVTVTVDDTIPTDAQVIVGK